MPKDVSCPNPGCSHIFPEAAVAGVAALVCPRCGGVFQVKAKKEGALPDVVARPVSRGPSALTSAPFAWFLIGFIVFLSLGLTIAVFRRKPATTPAGPEPFRSIENNYSLKPPGMQWQQDADLAKRLGGVLAFRRENPDARVVLAVRQFPTYVPSQEELKDEAVARLRAVPIENLQQEEQSKGASFAGRSAGRLVFQGLIGGTIVSGDVHFLTYQGAAYWLYRWCPATEVEQVAADLAEITDHFALLDLRPHWQPPRKTFSGRKLAYRLTAYGDRWEKAAYPPESYDPLADLALIGSPRDGGAESNRQALVLVLLFPAGEASLAERAKAYLLARQKDIYPETRIAEISPAAEQPPGSVLALKMTNTKERERFVVFGLIPRPKGPVVIWAECDGGQREAWEADFRKLIGSFQFEE